MATGMIQEFIQALNEEIQAIKENEGESILPIVNGRFLREASGLFVYTFAFESFLSALDDSPGEIEVGGKRYRCHVLSTQGSELQIGIDCFCGNAIPQARLQTNPSYLLELLKSKYVECCEKTGRADFGLSDILFKGKQEPCSTFNGQVRYGDPDRDLNKCQKEAIDASVSKQLSLIWGPPGTGKTKTVAKAIEAHLNAGHRVLLVSHANNAVDEALEKVAVQLKDTAFYQEGKLVRLGTPPVQQKGGHLEKIESTCELVLLNRIVERHTQSLASEKRALLAASLDLQRAHSVVRRAVAGLQTLHKLFEELATLKAQIADRANSMQGIKTEVRAAQDRQVRSQEKLAEAQNAGNLRRFFA
jgi:hypothetical protein